MYNKSKTTTKALKALYGANLRQTGYCNMQYLLRNHAPTAYNSGVYGWNYDVYNVYGLTICTGYRNTAGKRLKAVHAYERRAMEIAESRPYTSQDEDVEELLREFCEINR